MDRQGLYKEYLERQKFEHELINRHVTWLLTSQTILFAAYGLGLSSDRIIPKDFLCVVAYSGLVSSFLLFIGISANVMAKGCSWRDYMVIKDEFDGPSIPASLNKLRENWGVRTPITWIALLPDVCLPILFFVAWAYLL
jgi:hypothetical protein